MDIYERAEQLDADYLDMNTCYIYKIQEYNMAKRLGLPTQGIEVYDTEGNFIGIAGRKAK